MEPYQVSLIISGIFMIVSAIYYDKNETLSIIWGFIASSFFLYGLFELTMDLLNLTSACNIG